MTLLTKMADYLVWANDTIWEIVKRLSEEEFRRPIYNSRGSIFQRYVHLAEDTWEWFHDWHGEESEEPDFQRMTQRDLYQFISQYVKRWCSFITERTVDEFKDERDGRIVVITFEEMFFHLVNHFTYHRGQIAMSLRMLGKDVSMTDYVPYRFSV